MQTKIAVIGDRGSVQGFKAVGFDVFEAEKDASIAELVNDLALGDGVCFDADVAVSSKRNLPVNMLQQHSLMPKGETQSCRYPPSSLLTSMLRKNAAASSPIAGSAVIRLRSVYMAFVFSL